MRGGLVFSLAPAAGKNAWASFPFRSGLRPSATRIEDGNVAASCQLKLFREALFEIQAIAACRLEPCRGDEIGNQHAVDQITEIASFDSITDFKRINFVVAARGTPIDPGVGQHFEQFVAQSCGPRRTSLERLIFGRRSSVIGRQRHVPTLAPPMAITVQLRVAP